MDEIQIISLLKTTLKESFIKKIIKVETQAEHFEFHFKPDYKVTFNFSPAKFGGLFFVDIEYYNTILKKEYTSLQMKDSSYWYYKDAVKGKSIWFHPQIDIRLKNPSFKLNNEVFLLNYENEIKIITGIPFKWKVEANKYYETLESEVFVILSPLTEEWHIFSKDKYYNIKKEHKQKFLNSFENGLCEDISEMTEKSIPIIVSPFFES